MHPFNAADFDTYRSWYDDPELNRTLGPLDDEWLDHVLGESPPRQFSFFEEGKLVAVLGIEGPKPGESTWYITDIAVDPSCKRDGVGQRVLSMLLETYAQDEDPPESWIAFVDAENEPALQFFSSMGWTRSKGVDKDNFYQLFLEKKS